MKWVRTALLLSVVGLSPVPSWAQDLTGDAEWAAYRNERFGFTLSYPARVFHVEKRSEAGDGQVFISKDGEARLLVGAFSNSDKHTLASYQDYVLRNSYANYTVTYQRRGESWFVASGKGDGKTFYEKVMFTCGGQLINSFVMIYPDDQRSTFDPIVERIEDTFRPATRCEHRTPRTTANRAKSRTAIGRPPARAVARADGPRSILADRIARERGRDVIVILRRTGPPYDRKILRGYVSR
jgi:hypothetical protein